MKYSDIIPLPFQQAPAAFGYVNYADPNPETPAYYGYWMMQGCTACAFSSLNFVMGHRTYVSWSEQQS